MSERYATLFKCVVPQAQKNAPIILTAGVLLGDKQTGSVLAQVKMQNIGDRGITAVYASLMCVDAMNKAIEPAVDARYLDLNVKPGEYFADRQPIVIANTTVRSYTLRVTDIMFDDGTSWKSEEGTTFEKIPEFENAYTSEQLAQLRLETGKREFAFSEVQFGCIKRCYCGQWNIQSNHTCVKCHCDFLEIAAIADPVLLTQKYEERKKIEAEEAEQRRIEAERRRIETERKKEEARIAREKAAKEAAEAAALGEYKDSSIRAAALYGQRFETISTEDANGLRIYYDPEAQGYGLLDSKADVFVEPLYSEIALNTNGAYTVYLSGKCGVLAKDGKCLLEPQYDAIYESIGIEGTPLYKVSRSEQKGLLHIDGTILIPVEYDEISVFSGIGESSYYQVKSGSKVGLLNADGTDFISIEYDVIKVVNGIGQSTYYQVKLEKKTGLLNANGTIFLPVEYDDVTLGTNEYFVMQNGQMGIVNIEGVTLVSPTYDDIETMGDGRYLVSKDHSYGVIDQSGNIIVGIDYDSITLENTGTYTTTVDFKYGIVAYDGTVVHEPNMQEIKAGSNDGKYLMFKQDGLYGFLDASTFEVIVAAEWKDATIMYDGYAYIYNNLDKWGVISASGKVIVSPTWGNIKYLEDCGCALRSSDGSSSWGSNQSYLMNSRGTLIADFSKYNESVDYLGNGCFTNRGGEMLYDATTSTAYSYTVNDRDVGGLRMLNNGLLAGYYRRGSSWNSPSCYGVLDSSIPKIISSVAWEEPITVLPCRNRCDEKYGWINEKSVDMIKATYDYIRPFTVNCYIVAANYNDRGNLVYLLIDAATGSIVAKDIKTEVEAINYYDEKAVDSISLHEKIIISLIDMGFGYESSEEFLAALLAEDDSTAEDLYYDTVDEYHSVVYEFWDDIEYDIDDGELNTEEKVWNRIRKSMAN